ncbi:Eco57I restriction-modification methylase domain-containing protein [Natrinema caseinilyticum]|uniref:Eco57I restriction-modification methylase domain-containing protein n=1 Tax=Natrinema caseinilyticum TaxID=2961570 RepID=UPI0020C20847|nr:TaqI-like C-terminal specificity domain-containing protein [Natrinema caseinilyticum]
MREAAPSDRPYARSTLFARYYLDERIQNRPAWDCDEAAADAMERLRGLFDGESDPVSDDPFATGDRVREVLDVLGFGSTHWMTAPDDTGAVDVLLLADTPAGRESQKPLSDADDRTDPSEHALGIVAICRRDDDATTPVGDRPIDRTASDRIARVLERTPETIGWGILTNGRTWRLYRASEVDTPPDRADDETRTDGTDPSEIWDDGVDTDETHGGGTDARETRSDGIDTDEAQACYEIDLPNLLERDDSEDFKYFYALFRAAAFRESAGRSGLDSVRAESEAVVRELGADLEETGFAVLRLLGRGFVETNDLDVDPSDDERLEELKTQSLVLLYRLLIVCYAESRGLVRPADPDGTRMDDAPLGLEAIRLEVYDEIGTSGDGFDERYDARSTALWGRLETLFRWIDDRNEHLGLPGTDGGLFDRSAHELLAANAVGDRYLAEALYRLSTTETDDGRYVPIEYADLETRHLGNGYEALLEQQFRIAPTEYAGVPADGETVWKPATEVTASETIETVDSGGLYVVTDDGDRKTSGTYYTPDAVVSDVVEKTVGPLLDEIRDDLSSGGLEPGTDEYVDAFVRAVTDVSILDPAMGSGHFLTRATAYLTAQVMAEARRTNGPTTVDEGRVRRAIVSQCIYGVDRNEMAVEVAKLTLWLETAAADGAAPALDHHLAVGNSLVGSTITERLSTETLTDLASTADVDEWNRTEPRFRRLVALANVATAARFDREVPDDACERVVRAIEDEDAWADLRTTDWFRRAQSASEAEGFFHWDLEFPDVVLDENGRRRDHAGFDAVIGNPPWVATAGRGAISATMDRSLRAYLETEYESTRQQFDLYVAFTEQFVRLAADGRIGIVVPDAILTREQNAHVRRYLLDRTNIAFVLHLGTAFDTVENGVAVLVTGAGEGAVKCASTDGPRAVGSVEYDEIPQSVFREQDEHRFLLHLNRPTRSILQKLASHPKLGERVSISRGEEISKRADVLSDAPGQNESEAIVPGSAIEPYGFDAAETRYISPTEIDKDREQYRSPKLVFRQTAAAPTGALDTESRVTIKSVYNIAADDSETDLRHILGVLNSSLLEYYHEMTHAAYRSVFPQINQSTFESYPIAVPTGPEFAALVTQRIEATRTRGTLTLDLEAHLGEYRWGDPLWSIGSIRPAGPDESPLSRTATELTQLRLGRATVTRRSAGTVVIEATARYKPADATETVAPGGESECETDQWGYTETDPIPAFRLTDLERCEADLIEAFVPVAVDEAGGFANVRKTATKTISLVDRLRALTLPALEDVRDGLERYLETTDRAAALTEQIEETDRRIDALVYERYGLTEDEIDRVEAVVSE